MELGSFVIPRGEITPEDILDPVASAPRKTKVVATIGPSCWETETLVRLIDAGMDIARLNLSHGDHTSHGDLVKRIREANKQRPGKTIGIMLDTRGPDIRTGLLDGGESVDLTAGQELEIVTDYSYVGDETKIACSYKKLPQTVTVGSQILIGDGSIVCEVLRVAEASVVVRVQNNSRLGERKNVCLPGAVIDIPTVTQKDVEDIENFALKYNVDFIALSYTRYASDIEDMRNTLGPRGVHIKILAKIENHEGIRNFDEIIQAADGAIVARGDLGMELPPERVFIAQKLITRRCNLQGKPVVVARQMLQSMTRAPRPTRAEASDVANAVIDGADAVMLQSETANGKFPVDAVEFITRICSEAERALDYSREFYKIKNGITWELSNQESVCAAAVRSALELRLKLILVLSETGSTAQFVAKYRPPMPVLVASSHNFVIYQSSLTRGLIPVKLDEDEPEKIQTAALEFARNAGLIEAGDAVIVLHGRNEADASSASLMKVVLS